MANSGKSVQREYREQGIPIGTSNNDVKIGIDQLNAFQKNDKWFITENCPKLIWEMRRYRWKTRQTRVLQEKNGNFDEPHKKDDHAIDSCRYLFVKMPKPLDLPKDRDRSEVKKYIQTMLDTRTVYNVSRGAYDPSFRANPVKDMEVVEIDEHMGGLY